MNINGHCYYIGVDIKISYNAAMSKCQNIFGPGFIGRLFEPRLKKTHDLVIAAALVAQGSAFTKRYWIGINDKSSEGQFHYESGGSLVWSNWGSGQLIFNKSLFIYNFTAP